MVQEGSNFPPAFVDDSFEVWSRSKIKAFPIAWQQRLRHVCDTSNDDCILGPLGTQSCVVDLHEILVSAIAAILPGHGELTLDQIETVRSPRLDA